MVFIVQGLYIQDTKYIKPVEFTRADGYNEQVGKISKISVKINNQDTMSHNYTVEVLENSELFSNETFEVLPDEPFVYSMTFPIGKQYDNSTGLVEDSIHNASFTVYRDDRAEPIDNIVFKFD